MTVQQNYSFYIIIQFSKLKHIFSSFGSWTSLKVNPETFGTLHLNPEKYNYYSNHSNVFRALCIQEQSPRIDLCVLESNLW